MVLMIFGDYMSLEIYVIRIISSQYVKNNGFQVQILSIAHPSGATATKSTKIYCHIVVTNGAFVEYWHQTH